MNLSLFAFKFIDVGFDYMQNYKKYPGLTVIKDLVYDEKDPEVCKLDIIYKPKEGKYPVYMNIHGGGFIAGDKKHRRSFSSFIADEGFFVFNINYGLSPKYRLPEFMSHCITALDYIYANAEKYNLDLTRVTVGGDSAGGYMSALIGAMCTNEAICKKLNLPAPKIKVKGLLMISGSYDMATLLSSKVPFKMAAEMGETMTGIPKKKLYNNREAFREYPYFDELYPESYINSSFPISFMSHSTKDFFVPKQGEVFSELLRKNNVKVYEHKATRMIDIHCYPIFRFNKAGKEAIGIMKEFLAEIKS